MNKLYRNKFKAKSIELDEWKKKYEYVEKDRNNLKKKNEQQIDLLTTQREEYQRSIQKQDLQHQSVKEKLQEFKNNYYDLIESTKNKVCINEEEWNQKLYEIKEWQQNNLWNTDLLSQSQQTNHDYKETLKFLHENLMKIWTGHIHPKKLKENNSEKYFNQESFKEMNFNPPIHPFLQQEDSQVIHNANSLAQKVNLFRFNIFDFIFFNRFF